MKEQHKKLSIDEKRALLRQQLQNKLSRSTALPLSKGQSAMFFLHQMEPDSSAYHILFSGRSASPIHKEHMNHALRLLIKRHPALRTTFRMEDKAPIQIVHNHIDSPVLCCAVDHWTEEAIFQRVLSDSRVPFDLEHGPLLRVHLYTTHAETVLLLVLHHIISDYWSLAVLIDELGQLYEHASQNTIPTLPPVSAQYCDFVRWQAKMIEEPRGKQLKLYWEQQLAGKLPYLELATDHARPLAQTFTGSALPFCIDAAIVQQLHLLSSKENVTPFVLLLAVFQLFLHRYTGQDEILLGTPTAGRSQGGFEDVIGYFANPVVIRAHVSGSLSLRTLIQHMRKTALEAIEHQDYPFPNLVEALQLERDAGRSPIFQAMFAFQRAPRLEDQQFSLFMIGHPEAKLHLHGLQFLPYPLPQQEGQFDLSLTIIKDGLLLQAAFLYNNQLFDESTIQRMTSNFTYFLQSALRRPDDPVHGLPIVAEGESALLLNEWSTHYELPPVERCIHEQLDAIAARVPEQTAVVCGSQRLSYGELANASDRIAQQLRASGVQTGMPVGFLISRALLAVPGIVAIWKAGGIYVPLDAEYPPDRLHHMIADSGIRFVLTLGDASAIDEAPDIQQVPLEAIDSHAVLAAGDGDFTLPKSMPDSIAYILYTSGSTGKPKGVAVRHDRIAQHLKAIGGSYELTEQDNVLQFSSFNFDTSIEQLFAPLLAGARVVMRGNELWNPNEFLETLQKEQITVSNLPTAYWFGLISTWKQQEIQVFPQAFRLFIVGGEAMLPRHVAIWRSLGARGVRLFNAYGPTEALITSHLLEITDTFTFNEQKPIPIGQAVCGRSSYVLDASHQPVPIGVPGELYISGQCIAEGYWGNSALSEQRFLPDRFHPYAESKLYRTGDLVRYLSDGTLDFLGRSDNQVKIRGFRIELDEIEAALLQHPSVSQGVVAFASGEAEGRRLIAYIAPVGLERPASSELRRYLKNTLPEYSIPAAFVWVDTIPLTPNGKADRNALLALGSDQAEVSAPSEPRSELEKHLTEIWARLLKCPTIGIQDNFFEAGGDSILALQMIVQAEQHGIVIRPKQIFEHQTIAELAAAAQETSPTLVSMPDTVWGEVPLTPIQHWFFEQDFPNPGLYNQSVLLTVTREMTPKLVERALQLLVEKHDALRMRFVLSGGSWSQLLEPDAPMPALHYFDLSAAPESEHERMFNDAAVAIQNAIDLSSGRLVQAAWFERGSELAACVCIAIHHLVVDGVSWRILLNDLHYICHQLSNGTHTTASGHTSPFSTWAAQLQVYAQSSAVVNEMAYWRGMKGIEPGIPLDFPGGVNSERSARHVRQSLSVTATQKLLRECPKAYYTGINDLLLAALMLAYYDWSGQSDLLLDMESHGREEWVDTLSLSRTVGWFTSLFPLALSMPASATVEEAIRTVKASTRLIPQQGIGYGMLTYLCSNGLVARAMRTLPRPQISFNYLGQLDIYDEQPQFAIKQVNPGIQRDPLSLRSHVLQVDCSVMDDALQMDWTYSDALHAPETITTLATLFMSRIEELLEFEKRSRLETVLSSDFPFATINDSQLWALIESYPKLEDMFRLSPMQAGMLFHSALHTEASPSYIGQFQCELHGTVNIPLLRQAFEHTVGKFPSMRAAFVWKAVAEPIQIINQTVDLPWTELDLSVLPAEARREQLARIIHEDRQMPFDVAKPPLMRFQLIRMDAHRHHFIWTQHHLLLDGWSLAILLNEAFSAYDTLCRQENLRSEQAISYRVYIEWLAKQSLEQAEAFWREYLSGFNAPTIIPSEPSSERTDEWVALPGMLTEKETDALIQTCRTCKVTLNTLLQGLWATLLSWLSGHKDVMFGATSSGRPASLRGVEQIVGLFINTIPVRAKLEDDMPLAALLHTIQNEQSQARNFDYTPLPRIQSWSSIPRPLELFQSIFVMENYPIERKDTERHQLRIERPESYMRINYPLVLEVTPGDRLMLKFEFDSSCFTSDSVMKWSHLYRRLIMWTTISVDRTVTEIEEFLQSCAMEYNKRDMTS